MKTTIVEKVINLLSKETCAMTLKDIYPKLKEHTPASIRGNINRYISNNKNPKIRRMKRGLYSIVEVLTIENIDEDTKKISYVNECKLNNQRIAFFHKDYLTKENVKVGIYNNNKEFNNYNDMINDFNSISSVVAEGDSRDILKRFKDASFDCLITDPAYACISGGTSTKKGKPSGILSKNDGKIFKHNNIKFEEWLSETYRVLKEGSHAYIFTNFLNLQDLMNIASKVGFKFHNLLVWAKNNKTPNRWYMKGCEYILFCRKGKAKSINNMGSNNVIQINNILGDKIHETEKPLELISEFVLNSTKENDWILDTFGGSFVLNIAGLIHNRKVFSIDLDDKYITNGINRIKNFIKHGEDRNITYSL